MDNKALCDAIGSLRRDLLRQNDYGMVTNYVHIRGRGFIDLEQFIELYEQSKRGKK